MGGYATFTTEQRAAGRFVSPARAHRRLNTCFSVASADERSRRRGGRRQGTMAAQDSPYGRVAGFEDPWAPISPSCRPGGLERAGVSDEPGR